MWTKVKIGGAFLALTIAVTAGAQERKDEEKPLTDAEFVKKAVSCGLAQVEMAKIVKDRGTDPDVKKFAETMATDHAKCSEELSKIAKDASIPVPTKPEAEEQKHIDMLRDYKGTDFDKMYMKHMVEDHEVAVKMCTRAGQELKNEQLKALATKTLPALKDHLETAKKIHERLDRK